MISVKELIKHYENMKNCASRTNETEESDVIIKGIESDQNENSLGKVNDLINYWETMENGEESVNTLSNSAVQREYTLKYFSLSFDIKVTFVKVRDHLLFLLKGKESDTCLKPSELTDFFKYNSPNGLMDQSTVRFIINRSE